MTRQTSSNQALRIKVISAAVASCFAVAAQANPTGPNVTYGSVTFNGLGTANLTITNQFPGNAIINWNGFSIAASELTKFQQFANLAVLNRVTGGDPSSILGRLQSDGRVFLINPNGIVFGAGAQIDVAGLVASSLNLTDGDFLAGRMRFQEVPGAGAVANFGNIFTPAGGGVYLVGPAVTNGGLISSPQGEVVLAAGNSVELMNVGTPGLSVSLTAPGNEALNIGRIMADSGRVGIFGGVVNQGGTVSANTAVFGTDGSIKLVATSSTTFAAGSQTIASGALSVETGDLTVAGNVQSGPQSISAAGALTVRGDATGSGQLTALGGQSISARSVDVSAQNGGSAFITNNGSGDQAISVAGGGASTGLDVRVLSGGGTASIANNAPGATQIVNVSDADHISVNGVGTGGASIFAVPGTQLLSITGGGANEIRFGSAGAQGFSQAVASNQMVIAGLPGESGSISIVGSAGNSRLAGIVSQPGAGNSQTVSTAGLLSITGGSAPAQLTNFPAGIFHNGTGQQTINAQSIALRGGSTGTNNSAQIGANNGTQFVVAGDIALAGGSGGTGNSAQLRANQGLQTILSQQVSLAAGTGGTVNFATITAPTQSIAVNGDLTISGGGSLSTPTTGAGARIGGGGATPTNLALTVGGNVTLNGGTLAGSGSAIGNGATGGQRTDISMTVGGDVTLNPGSVANAGSRLGSPNTNVAGGAILVNAGGAIALNSAGPGNAGAIRTTEGVTLRAREISQGPDAVIQANSLTLETQQGASLVGANSVNTLSAMNWFGGDVAVNNASSLLTVNAVSAPSSNLTLSQSGDLLVIGTVQSGPQAISATGGLTVRGDATTAGQLSANGGQTINARYVEVNAAGGSATILNFGGDQRISTTGTNAAGEGLAVRNTGGGFASIQNTSGQQVIDVRDADRVVLDSARGAASIVATNSVQTVSVTGTGGNALVLGSPASVAQSIIAGGTMQTVIAGEPGELGSITIQGTMSGGPANNFIVSAPVSGGTQSVSTSGALTVLGGSAASGSAAGVFANGTGQQTINAQNIVLRGGSLGANNSAIISANSGTQNVNAGSIVVVGGAAGTANGALLRATQGQQTIVADQISVTAGVAGTNSFAGILAPMQDITVRGDLTIAGGGSLSTAPIGGGARIGGGGGSLPSVTNLMLDVGGNVTLNGGTSADAGASIGSSAFGALRGDITMTVGGNITLNPGAIANAGTRIGSSAANVAGGEIVVNAGGAIALNSAGPGNAGAIRTMDGITLRAREITQGPDAVIQANTLSIETQQGASLVGANAVNSLNAVNSTSGAVAFNNASPLLTVTGIDQVPSGALSLNQAGNLLISGNVSSGAQSIAASGDMTVAAGAGHGVTVLANGAQSFNAGGSFSLLGGSAFDGYVQTIAMGPLEVRTGGNLTVQGGSGFLAYGLLYGAEDVRLTVGNEVRLNGGAWPLAFARIQSGFWDKIYLDLPNQSSGGYFVDGREGVTHKGLDGFYTGVIPAKAGRSLILTYGD